LSSALSSASEPRKPIRRRSHSGKNSKDGEASSGQTCGVGDGGAEGGEVEGVLAVAHGCGGGGAGRVLRGEGRNPRGGGAWGVGGRWRLRGGVGRGGGGGKG
jgi:hypothetical protein